MEPVYRQIDYYYQEISIGEVTKLSLEKFAILMGMVMQI